MSHQYLLLPGAAGDYASTPDHADFDFINNDFSIRALIALDDWTPSGANTVIHKGGAISDFWRIHVLTSALRLELYNGSNRRFDSTVGPSVTDGDFLWIRIDFDFDNGSSEMEGTWYTGGSDETPSWSQLGTPTTRATTDPIVASNGAVQIGQQTTGFNMFAGKAKQLIIYRDLTETDLIGDFDADDFTVGDSDTDTAVDSAGKTWTINGAAEIQAESSGSGNLLLLGVG